MSKQQVPWAEGRRALIRPIPTMGWEDARAEVSSTGERVWVEVRPRDALAWADSVPRAPVPGQCPECFDVEAHTPDCARGKRIAENLARGVPAFWCEWAMWTYPAGGAQAESQVEILAVWPAHGQIFRVDARRVEEGERSNAALVALGPEGPTLAPWGV